MLILKMEFVLVNIYSLKQCIFSTKLKKVKVLKFVVIMKKIISVLDYSIFCDTVWFSYNVIRYSFDDLELNFDVDGQNVMCMYSMFFVKHTNVFVWYNIKFTIIFLSNVLKHKHFYHFFQTINWFS